MPTLLEASFPRGKCPIQVFGDGGSRPIVLFFMDAFGPRPATFEIAARLEKEGYLVLLPHLFYQFLPFEPFDAANLFSGGDEGKRLMGMFGAITQPNIDADVAALLAIAKERGAAGVPIGCVGYCMGGRYALTAATASPQVAFAASFHGSMLAPDTPESSHRRFAGVKARIYVGVAHADVSFQAAEEGRLAAALREADVDHAIETYAGAHGFVMKDLPVYNAAASERHWQRVSTNLKEMFASRTGAAR